MMHQPPDLPPIPRCFSHLVNTLNNADGERSYRGNNLQTNCMNSNDMSTVFSRTAGLTRIDSLEGLDHPVLNGRSNRVSGLENDTECQGDGVGILTKCETRASDLAQQSSAEHCRHISEPARNPFVKLNSSLHKLQKEMKNLRCLDISLFCQLLSLHEAIQDFKLTMSDRYSETASEYSFGTASYMGSMSSLNDDSDWGEDFTLLNSCSDLQDSSEIGENMDETNQSASNLLKQITDLALRADQDF